MGQCLTLIRARANDVLQLDDITELSVEAMEMILADDRLVVEGENVVYGACVNWANQRCLEVEENPTTENLRKHLGSLFKHIRFTNLLDQQLQGEMAIIDDVLNNFHLLLDSERNSLKLYRQQGRLDSFTSGLKRTQRLQFCELDRYNRVCPSRKRQMWECQGFPDTIAFQCNESIYLLGISVYGPERTGVSFTVKVVVKDHDNNIATKPERREELPKRSIESMGDNKPYKLYFKDPVYIIAEKVYAITVLIEGPDSFYGMGGQEVMTCHDVTFTFKEKTKSPKKFKTSINRGQIPQLLFRLVNYKVD